MKQYIIAITTFALLANLLGCATTQQGASASTMNRGESKFFTGIPSQSENQEESGFADVERGYAAWYGKEMHGRPTASGEIYNMYDFTASHRTYPMGSIVLIRNLENGKKHLATINDRGPYVDGRIADVSYAVAESLDFVDAGVARVEVELIEVGQDNFMAKRDKAPVSEVGGPVTPSQQYSDDFSEPFSEPFGDQDPFLLSPTESGEIDFLDGSSPKGYTVRVGAFKSRRNAENYREELEDAYRLPVYLGSQGIWNYVWVGDFGDEKEAGQFMEDLKTDGREVMNPGKVR